MIGVKIKILTMVLLFAVSYEAHSQTELYKQYEHRTEFTVMCIMNCPINDSLKIDVTLFVSNSKENMIDNNYLIKCEFKDNLDDSISITISIPKNYFYYNLYNNK